MPTQQTRNISFWFYVKRSSVNIWSPRIENIASPKPDSNHNPNISPNPNHDPKPNPCVKRSSVNILMICTTCTIYRMCMG